MKNLLLFLSCLLCAYTNAQKIALNFAGDDDWVTGTNSSLPQGNAPRTIETWIRYSTSKNDMSIFNYGTFAYNQKFTLHLYNGVYIIGEGNDMPTGYQFNDGNWHHLAVTHDGATTVVYVDGNPIGSRNTTYNTTGFDYQIGVSLRNSNWDFRFEGTVDELRVWNVARTEQEIFDNMYNSIGSAPGLIASYHFNDGLPNADNRAITTVVDGSGNGSHGTLNNFALIGTSSNFVDDAVVLPLHLLGFSVTEANCTAIVKWQTADENNMQSFVLEESRDAMNFSPVKQVTPNNTSGENDYTVVLPVYTDRSFYRLKQVDAGNKITYSKIVVVKANGCGPQLKVWPNPATTMLTVRTEAVGSEYRLYNTTGVLVKKGLLAETVQNIDISKFSKGLYYIDVSGTRPMVFLKK